MRPRVDARFDGEGHARLEHLAVAGHDVRVLVYLQADPVTGAVEERLAVAGLGDRLAGGRVYRLGGDARPDGGACRLLGALQDLVVGREFGRRLTDRVGAGAVRAVTRGHHAADVHHHGVAGLQDPVRYLVVRAGRVGPRGHDHEVHRGVPLGPDGLGDVRADFPF